MRRVHEIRIAWAPDGEKGDSLRRSEEKWRETTRRDDRLLPQEKPKMTKAEYDATLGDGGRQSRREWVVRRWLRL